MRSRKLPRCPGCWLPPPLCVCAQLPVLVTRTRLVLLVHHVETIKSTNTGRLLARMLAGTSVRVLGAPDRAPPAPLPEGPRLLLFPEESAPVLSADMAGSEPPLLLVPDGTWRQARRMCSRDPDAKKALAVRLPEGAPTRYSGLRQSERPGALSTIEAAARALGILEGEEIEARIMAAFEVWLERSLYVREHGTIVAMECARRGDDG